MKKKLFIANYLIPVLFIIHYFLIAAILNVIHESMIGINYLAVLSVAGIVSVAYIIIRLLIYF